MTKTELAEKCKDLSADLTSMMYSAELGHQNGEALSYARNSLDEIVMLINQVLSDRVGPSQPSLPEFSPMVPIHADRPADIGTPLTHVET